MTVLVPADYVSAYHLILGLAEAPGPTYLRLGGTPVPSVYVEADEDFAPGGARLLREGNGVTLCACGIMVREALAAAEILSRQGIEADVVDCYSLKPLPEQILVASVRRTGCCVVCEEHSRIGGLCGALAERFSVNYPVPMRFVAVEDRFGQSGRSDELQEYYGLTQERIVGAAAQAWALRRR
jgi:transketolase